jgi:RNA polymerase sigma factor (sigma-70 family)
MKKISDLEFEEAIVKYGGLIYYFSQKYFLKGFDKEDLQQEFRMVLFNCMQYYNPKDSKASFLTYYTQSIRNFITNELLSRRQKLEYFYVEEAYMSYLTGKDNIEAMILIVEIEKNISEHMKTIPLGKYFLRIAYGETQIKIAKELNVSSQYISFMYLKAMKEVQELFEEHIKAYNAIKLKYNLEVDLFTQNKDIIKKELEKNGI